MIVADPLIVWPFPGPRSSGDRAAPSGGVGVGSNPTGGTHAEENVHEIWAAYEATHLHVLPDGETEFVVTSTTADTVDPWPFESDDVWVITACNPRSKLLDDDVNSERHEQLREVLTTAGYHPIESVGRQPDGDWQEEGFVVPGIDEETVTRFALQFEQNAVFHWTPSSWSIHGVLQPGRHTIGWRRLSPKEARLSLGSE